MGALATQINFGKLWTQSDQVSERMLQKVLLDGLDKRVESDSGVISKLTKGSPLFNPVVRWMEEEGYPTSLTAELSSTSLTISGELFKAAVTAANIRKVVRVGTVFERPSDGLQISVTSVAGIADGSPFVATVQAHGSSTLPSNDTDGPIMWDIVDELWDEFRDIDETRMKERKFREGGYQMHAETFEMGDLRKDAKYEIVGDEWQHQTVGLVEKMNTALSKSIIRMEPKFSNGVPVYGNSVAESAMCGILSWPKVTQAESANPLVYVNLANANLKQTDINNMIRNLWLTENANYNAGNWAIVVHPLLQDRLHDMNISYRRTTGDEKTIGFSMDEFHSKVGKTFPIVSDRYMRQGTLAVCNFSPMRYGYYGKQQLNKKEISTQGAYSRWLIHFTTYGVVVRDPRANIGIIYGCKTA
jgi:hypothetical protein